MNKILLLILCLHGSIFLSAQEYVVLGKVVNKDSQPLEFVEVVLLNEDAMIVQGKLTNEEGEFNIETQKGKYSIRILKLGDILYTQNLEINTDIDLGIIKVEAIHTLKEVVILAEKKLIEKKSDRLVFHVENSIVASTGTGFDILQKVPGIRIQGDDIHIIGKSAIKVLVNTKLIPLSNQDLSDYLKTLDGDTISKIEVITNPPAKYEAEGNSGLVNIVLKKVKTDNFGGNIKSTYKQATYLTGYLGGNIQYQKNKVSLFAAINSGYGSIQPVEANTFFNPTQIWDTENRIRYFTKAISSRAGIDYDVSRKSSLGIQYLGSIGAPDIKEKTRTNIINNESKEIDSLLRTDAISDREVKYHSLNVHYKTAFDSIGKNMSADVDYFTYKNTFSRLNTTNSFLSDDSFIEGSTDIFKSFSNQNIQTISSAIDFEWPTTHVDFAFGGKVSFIKTDNNTAAFNFLENQFLMNENLSNIFKYRENIQALYVSMNKSIKKWDFKLGLRIEATQTQGNSKTLAQVQNNEYVRVFPTLYLLYSPHENHSYAFSYGKRIARPNYLSLNPFRWFNNPYSFTEGNPFLQPSFTDNFEVSHLFSDNLNTALYFSKTNNGSSQVTFSNPATNIQATRWRNFLDEYSIGFSQSYTFDTISWLESYAQLDLNYSRITSDIPDTISEQDGFNFNFSVDNSFFFNAKKTFFGELNFWYASSGVDGVDILSESYNLDLGLKAWFLDKKILASLAITDILRTNQSIIKTTVNSVKQAYQNYYDRRQLRIALTYNFKNNRIRSRTKKFSNEEERNRANNN
ncbi:outer membrane beta-barrel family protein [Aquimarina sp. RZ0]|uniref:outer membrane beta-barrel family protein n=1 Tax=Aquimarina sp. RZ0 TaxID=2607730 RepID=UPI0011F36237|nr:outer membrane beta-barrel family protein [Aquimarina sp. RZ0]KAA1244090.1 TonB-dependent receptor [Aquimarina sp. RZ0]